MDCMFTCYDNMYNYDTLSCSFLRTELSGDTKALPSRLSFEVKMTNIRGYYDLRIHHRSEVSKMIEGVNSKESYSSATNSDSFRMNISLESYEEMKLHFINAINAFKTNVMNDSTKGNFVNLSLLYKDFFGKDCQTIPSNIMHNRNISFLNNLKYASY